METQRWSRGGIRTISLYFFFFFEKLYTNTLVVVLRANVRKSDTARLGHSGTNIFLFQWMKQISKKKKGALQSSPRCPKNGRTDLFCSCPTSKKSMPNAQTRTTKASPAR